ncbi:citrate lyase holo-[acyl-carrier protein] synthase [Vagococcus penaei]|uniref:citrate lyase holo-[acyl-carrier protein] synthase n=1 Tax=Vagococcus penaei TaxID=633807 RepID=A0A1Q2D889_9ENTE|nr:citrate lyase holo-[acyl-carrier protein] synthase [Vagococcus penaei]AQP54531.1 citrate lyase holo-[acyl-carrier protein] synthase [Vagococcus penaei]RSU06761.1 citrate lyase holo-[acyl-carrier protein] synthase [Vagococcus penaei]
MSNTLFDGPEITLSDVLDAREARVAKQYEILEANPTSALLSATMTIPGAIKTSVGLEKVFKTVMTEIAQTVTNVPTLSHLYVNQPAGYEFYLLVPITPKELKEKMIQIEETHAFGRLVDLDVVWLELSELKSLSREQLGYPRRRCFICSDEAKACGRSRKHSVEEMQRKISEIVEEEGCK